MRWLSNIFRRNRQVPQPLHIDGIPPAPMTPEPDDAELAAQALLENMSGKGVGGKGTEAGGDRQPPFDQPHDASYYRALSDRIRQARDTAMLRTMRFVSHVEEELQKQNLPLSGSGSLAMLEAELYKRIDIIERVGGDLKRRWQHCLADVTVRIMNHPREDSSGDGKEG